jgi:hypothetical protein
MGMHSLVRRFSTRLFNQAELLATVPGLHEACERRNVFENPPPDGFSATTFPLRWSDTAADRKAGATSSDGRPSIWDFLQRTMLAFEDVQYPRGNARARMPKRSFGEEGDDAASAPAHAHPPAHRHCAGTRSAAATSELDESSGDDSEGSLLIT